MIKRQNRQAKVMAGILALAMTMGGTSAFAADTTTTGGTGTTGTTTTGTTATGSTPTSTSTTTSASSSTSAATAVRVQFADVLSNQWYTKPIMKLAALGIVQGYEKNEFRPNNEISQQEAIVMAIRMMGLDNELKNVAYVLPLSTNNDLFKPYIALAIDKGLIDIKEETDGTTTASKTTWGEKPATREWVAKVVIRAIGKEVEAKQQALSTSAFTDTKDYSPWAAGYINAAYNLKIVNGLDDSKFGPKVTVTRAQMATFLSRSDQYLTTRSSRVTTGYAMEISDKRISVQDSAGKLYDFNITTDTVLFNAKDDTRIVPASIKLTNEVYVVAVSGTAAYIELTSDQERMESIEGVLNKAYVDQMVMAINQNGSEKLLELATGVTITDASGRGLSIGSIAPGSKVELKRNMLIKNSKWSQIVVKQVPISKKSEGSISALLKDQNKISLLETATGQTETYTIDARIAVINPDGTQGEFGKLKVGDQVAYEIVNNVAVTITVKKAADFGTSVQGTLTSINADKTIVTINKAGNSLGAYYIAENAVVAIEGLSNASLFDLEAGDLLKLDLVNDKVVKISVTNRSVNDIMFAQIVSYDSEVKLLTVKLANDSFAAYQINDATTYKIYDSSVPYNSFSSYLVKGKRVDLRATKDKLTSVTISQVIEGTITQINTAAEPDELTIRTASGQNLTFKLLSGTVFEVPGKGAGGTISDLKVGDVVKETLNFNQDMVAQVTVKKNGVYKVQVKNSSNGQISVKDDLGNISVFTIDNYNKIVKAGQASATFEDIGIDEYVKMSFTGSILDKVEVLNTVRGKVTGIDAATGSLTIQDNSNAVQVVTFGQNFAIKQNGTTSAALTNIKPNDRVEIIKDASDKTVINLATGSKRTVASYDYVLNQLVLKPTSGTDKTVYNFSGKAYLHRGMDAVAPNAFVENDEIMVYIIDDKIVEIEK